MAIGYGQACPKPELAPKKPRSRIRVTATPKAERRQIDAVRAACVERDGVCRFFRTLAAMYDGWAMLAALDQIKRKDQCDGPSEWAHMHTRRRSKTRGMDPAYRHDTAHSLMLCRFHHGEYDAKRLIITALTRKGADGPLKFRRAQR